MAEITTLERVFNKTVIKDTIRAVLDKKVSLIPFANVDTTLMAEQGATIAVSRYTFDGVAQEITEGEEIPIRALGTESAQYQVKMVGEGTSVTDMAVGGAAGGNVVGSAAEAIGDAIWAKIDLDMYLELLKAPTIFNANDVVSYNHVVDAEGLFQDEGNMEIIMFVNPDIIITLRKDQNFIDKNKYGNDVMMGGEIGMIGIAHVVRSRRVEPIGGFYYSPIVVTNDPDHKDDLAAITYFMKRDTNVEIERIVKKRLTEITADQIYVVALTNSSKVVLLKTTGANTKAKSMYDDEFLFPNTSVKLETTPIKGDVAITRTNATTWAAALALTGEAKQISASQKSGLGFDDSTTHYITCEIEIPGAGISESAPTATWNGSTVPAAEMRKIGASWYFDVVFGVKKSGTDVVLASGQTTFTVVCGGVTTTFTPNFSGITLE